MIRWPKDPAARLRLAGGRLYGRSYKARMAAGLGISRSTLHLWLTGHAARASVDIDAFIIDLVDRERAASVARRVDLAAFKREIETARAEVADVA